MDIFRDIFVVMTQSGEEATGIWGVEARGAAGHSTMHRTTSQRNCLASDVNCAKGEKSRVKGA